MDVRMGRMNAPSFHNTYYTYQHTAFILFILTSINLVLTF